MLLERTGKLAGAFGKAADAAEREMGAEAAGFDAETELAQAFVTFARSMAGLAEMKKEEKPARIEGIFGRLSPRKA